MSVWSNITEHASRLGTAIGMAIGRGIANGVLSKDGPVNRQERRRNASLARRRKQV